MTDEDYIVSCWPVPVKKRGQKEADYRELLQKVAVGCGGYVCDHDDGLSVSVYGAQGLKAYPGDVLCQRRSGAYGVRRGIRKG